MGLFPFGIGGLECDGRYLMAKFPLVNNLKVRVGYGLAGNQSGINSYTTCVWRSPTG